MESEGKAHFTLLGKAMAGSLAAAVALITIYVFLFPKEEKLVANGDYSEFSLPRQFNVDVNGHFKNTLDVVKEIGSLSLSSDLESPLRRIADEEGRVQETARQIQSLSGFVKVEITNEGDKEAENVIIELTDTGYFIILEGESTLASKFTNAISVGNIRPSATKTAHIWTSTGLNIYKPLRVTSPNGVALVQFKQAAIASWANSRHAFPIGLAVGFLRALGLSILFGRLGVPMFYYVKYVDGATTENPEVKSGA